MAARVREGIDYKLLSDDYRRTFLNTYKAKKDFRGNEYYRCIYCAEKTATEDMQVDHIIPKTRLKAGILWNPNKAWNLGASCQPCNGSKSNSLDKRVFIGFRNKVLSTFGLILADKNEEHEESHKTTAYISLLIALVSIVATIAIPVIGLVSLGLSALVSIVKFLFKKSKKTFRVVSRKMRKSFMKRPVRNTAIVALIIYTYKVVPGMYTRFFVSSIEAFRTLTSLL